jgi:two-component system phosphate regulon sensor histidine kinase PhoR
VHLEINNSAINIPHDLNGKAFDRFYRGHEIGSQLIEGSGLGLSLCKEIAKVHDAFIHLDTDEGKSVRAVLAFKTISIAAL